MRPHILVVDIETTGLRGEPNDHVVEVGVCRLNLDNNTIVPLYSAPVKPYYPMYEGWEKSWVFEHTTLTPAQVLEGESMEAVRAALTQLLVVSGSYSTSYNFEFDFDKFLRCAPWDLATRGAPCIMRASGRAYADDLPCSEYSGCPSAQSTYSYLCPDNPAKLPGGIEEHRALSDAIMEAHILRKMIQDGEYIIEGIE